MLHPYRSFLLLLVLLSPSYAEADLVLGLKWSDGTSSATARTINNGDTLSVDMFLLDTDGSTSLTEGLGAGGGSLFQTSGAATVTPISISPAAGFESVAGSIFDAPNFGTGAGGVPLNGRSDLLAGALLASDFFGPPAGVGLTNIPLVSYALTFTGADGDFGSINTDVYDSLGVSLANETYDTFQDLDAILTNFATNPGNFGSLNFAISSAAVPEASTMLVACLLIGIGFVVHRRKRIAAE